MRIFLFSAFLFWTVALLAQARCITAGSLETIPHAANVLANAVQNADYFSLESKTKKTATEDPVIRIPVIVHVLYNNAAQNISDAQIRSGIEALNRDFRRRAADTVNTPQRFKKLAADVQIEFALATADPFGRATTGIERKQVSRIGWMADDKMKHTADGGMNGWNSNSYLNIWIVNLIGGSGYSSVPGSAPENDGVVINYAAFGTINTTAPFHLGRTAVHEVGHWLGLKHIWGDAACGDDGINDTPPQGFFTKGCPSGFRSSCNNGTSGDMYMNFMDYTNDECMNLFTAGQRERMRSLFAEGGARASLLQSRGLSEPSLAEAPLPTGSTALYPNPATHSITVQVNDAMRGKNLLIYNSEGRLVKKETATSQQHTITVSELRAGVYFVKGEGYLQKFIKL
jgi:hypothetical protein